MNYNNFIILIPALDPPEHAPLFIEAERMGVKVVHHPRTMGKGTALRSVFENVDRLLGKADFYITADCDGQHTPEDIEKVARELLKHPDPRSGLRGFPVSMKQLVISTETFSRDATSHFRPVADLLKMYSQILDRLQFL